MSSQDHKAQIVFAPNPIPATCTTIFLSGSIDAAPTTWQETLSKALSHLSITILNPHRLDWDSSWVPDISFEPFRTQVNWELDGLERADLIVVYFGPLTDAPITLMELGLFARRGEESLVVACHEKYKKKGNVQVVCARFGIELLGSVDELIEGVMRKLRRLEGGERGAEITS